MSKISKIDFYSDNEKLLNRLVSKILLWATLSAPLLMLGKFLNIFSRLDYKSLLLIYGYMMIVALTFKILCYLKPYSTALKYIVLILTEILVFLISINKGFSPFISYILVPLISCLYFNKKFSLHISIISYITMLLSILIRAINRGSVAEYQGSQIEWGIGYGIGLTIEFGLNMIVLYYISSQNYTLINENIKIIAKIQTLQTTLTTSYAALITEKDEHIKSHLTNTTKYLTIITQKLRKNRTLSDSLNESYINNLISACPLHDIGIIAINDKLLNKKEPLSQEEFCIYKTHTIEGEKIIRENMSTIENREFLKLAREMALYHHENWNGTGYPLGKAGKDIPLSARILAVANFLDNILSDKPYREGYSVDKAFDIIASLSGIDFDPQIVTVLLQERKQIYNYIQQINNSTETKDI